MSNNIRDEQERQLMDLYERMFRDRQDGKRETVVDMTPELATSLLALIFCDTPPPDVPGSDECKGKLKEIINSGKSMTISYRWTEHE
jgi:hypothetical protein